MTFKVCNLDSKQPYFNRAHAVRVDFFFATSVPGAINGIKRFIVTNAGRTPDARKTNRPEG